MLAGGTYGSGTETLSRSSRTKKAKDWVAEVLRVADSELFPDVDQDSLMRVL